MDSFTLFAGNAVVVFVMAAAFLVAAKARRTEHFWYPWCLANIVIGLALLAFMFEQRLPDLFLVTVPNGLLVLGMSLRWQAAREFAGRAVPLSLVGAPLAVFIALCAWPWIFGSYAAVYAIVNVLLAGLAVACAVEFWRERSDGLHSRYGMIAAYGIMALSFVARVGQGLSLAADMPRHLPDDLMLTVHLFIALLHVTASGAFALSLAYERDALHLRRLAMHDSLTGLLNRHAFESRARAYLSACAHTGFAMVILDLDHFKQVNDTYGHAVGDEALRVCAGVLAKALRERGIAARWGGEEFVAILTEVTAAEALTALERIRREIRTTLIRSGGYEFRVTVSAGMCHGSCGITDFDGLMMKADDGLYSAKREGRDRVRKMVA